VGVWNAPLLEFGHGHQVAYISKDLVLDAEPPELFELSLENSAKEIQFLLFVAVHVFWVFLELGPLRVRRNLKNRILSYG
jgi:hypothetical protein